MTGRTGRRTRLTKPENKAFDSYRACLDWIFSRHRFVMKPGLERVEYLLDSVGNPHRDFGIVHVAGTNGKGSTAGMIASVLAEHGMRVGLYTSPHVVSYTERMTVDGASIRPARILDIIERLKPAADEIAATFFEITTAAAALFFSEEAAAIVVAEVGLGGRLDATNAFDSVLSVITRIAVDHAGILGAEPAAIAAEKGGIIREAGVVVCGASGQPADVIRGVAAARKARFIDVQDVLCVERISVTPAGSTFDATYRGRTLEGVGLSTLGRHQVANAATAIVAIHELGRQGIIRVSERGLLSGLIEARSLGRMQIIDRRPTVVADVAHNPDAAAALAKSLPEVFPFDRLFVVLGIMADKDIRGFMAPFRGLADFMVLTRAATDRAAAPDTLAAIADGLEIAHAVVPTPSAAIEKALSRAREGDLVLITGSHYTVGDVMASMGIGQTLEA